MKITRIPLSEDHLKQLQLLVEPKGNLRQHGFVTKPLTDEELLLKRRCLGCGKCKQLIHAKSQKVNCRSLVAA